MEKLIGNRLVKQYKEQDVLGNLGKTSDTFWRETRDAFRKGAEQVEYDWQKEMWAFREKVECLDHTMLTRQLNAEIEAAEAAARFFKNLSNRTPNA